MKIAIVTLTSANYGNRLQNYAVQTILEKMGYEVETLHNPYDKNLKPFKHHIQNSIKYTIGGTSIRALVTRERMFDKFDAENIKFSRYWLNRPGELAKIEEKYDCFVCGSDQVWNPTTYRFGAENFAVFARPKKRISLAASFGVDEFPKEREKEFASYLVDFNAISVREQSGAIIVKNLIGIEPTVLVDPVMCLDSNEWSMLEKKPQWLEDNGSFVLCYFLGKTGKEATEIAQKYTNKGCKIVNLMNKANPKVFASGPQEFLYLIHHAKAVLTDSFHGTVLSFLFNRPVVIFEREDGGVSMNTRLENFVNIFSLQNREYKNFKGDESLFCCDYSLGYTILEGKRKEFKDFSLNHLG